MFVDRCTLIPTLGPTFRQTRARAPSYSSPDLRDGLQRTDVFDTTHMENQVDDCEELASPVIRKKLAGSTFKPALLSEGDTIDDVVEFSTRSERERTSLGGLYQLRSSFLFVSDENRQLNVTHMRDKRAFPLGPTAERRHCTSPETLRAAASKALPPASFSDAFM